MTKCIVGIVVKLNPRLVNLKTYLPKLKRLRRYNLPKKQDRPGYKHLLEEKWLMLYDPSREAITISGKIWNLTYRSINPDFPCQVSFERSTLRFKRIPLRRIRRVFDNFEGSRRYRNITQQQFDQLIRR